MKSWEEASARRAHQYLARRSFNELNSLTDKELNDIGISRGDIYHLSQKVHK